MIDAMQQTGNTFVASCVSGAEDCHDSIAVDAFPPQILLVLLGAASVLVIIAGAVISIFRNRARRKAAARETQPGPRT